MENKEHFKKVYRHFSDFVAIAAARELEYFILDSKFTSGFNQKMRNLFQIIRNEGKEEIEFSILFNTEEEVVLIDSNILGRYIGNKYTISIEEYYKNASLNKIIREVVNGSRKSQQDFIRISYSILYRTFQQMYKEIKCKKEIINEYKEKYFSKKYEREDTVIIVLSLLILEDICRYLGFEQQLLAYQIGIQIYKEKNGQ